MEMWQTHFPNSVDFCQNLQLRGPMGYFSPLTPYDFQKNLLREMETTHHIVIESARQMGVTLMLCVYAMWRSMKHFDHHIQFVGVTRANLLSVKEIFQKLHAQMLPHYRINMRYLTMRQGFEFENGSTVTLSRSCDFDQRNYLKLNCVIADNVNHYQGHELDHMLTQIYPGTQLILASTGAGGCNYNHVNQFPAITIALPWYLHPHRDGDWAQIMQQALGRETFTQDYELK
jgi:hypothetical protein